MFIRAKTVRYLTLDGLQMPCTTSEGNGNEFAHESHNPSSRFKHHTGFPRRTQVKVTPVGKPKTVASRNDQLTMKNSVVVSVVSVVSSFADDLTTSLMLGSSHCGMIHDNNKKR